MVLVLSTAPPSWLWEGPAALDNREKVYTRTHIDILPAHAFWLLRWRLRLTNRCGRVRYAYWRSYRERLTSVDNLLVNRHQLYCGKTPSSRPARLANWLNTR